MGRELTTSPVCLWRSVQTAVLWIGYISIFSHSFISLFICTEPQDSPALLPFWQLEEEQTWAAARYPAQFKTQRH